MEKLCLLFNNPNLDQIIEDKKNNIKNINLNDFEGILKDQGLTVPGSMIDQGLAVPQVL